MTVHKVSTILPQHAEIVYIKRVKGRQPHQPSQLTIMRKIEKQMIAAIKSETDWKCGNTKVVNFFNDGDKCVVTSVFLHDNLIAEITDTDMMIFDGGYQSVTTKSRLNALCNEFCVDGECVYQKNFQWYVDKFVGMAGQSKVFNTYDFTNGFIFA